MKKAIITTATAAALLAGCSSGAVTTATTTTCADLQSTRRNRGTTPSAVSTVSPNITAGRTHNPRSPYNARYTTSSSSVSLCRATPSTSY